MKDYYARVINQTPKPYHEFAYHDVGLIYWKAGRTEEAIKFLRFAIELYTDPRYSSKKDPQYIGEAETNLGCLYLELGNTSESAKLLQRALGLQPRYCGSYNNFGVALERLGMREEAIKVLKVGAKESKGSEGERACLILRENLDHLLKGKQDPSFKIPQLTYSVRVIG